MMHMKAFSVDGLTLNKDIHVWWAAVLFGTPGQYFEEISQNTGRYCFGVEDTLESGAVDVLIVWENLDITRYTMLNHQDNSTYT